MDLHEVELKAEDLLQARYSRGLQAPELVNRATQLLEQLGDAPGTELLAYRLRLGRLEAAYDVWPAQQYFAEQQELFRLFVANLPHFPTHPLKTPGASAVQQPQQGLRDVIAGENLRAADKLSQEPVVSREDVEQALAQMLFVLDDTTDSYVQRARAYQRMGLGKQAHNVILAGQIPGMPAEDWSTDKQYTWAQWRDLAVRDQLERADVASAAQLVEDLEYFDGFDLEEYFFLLAETLIPLATVVDPMKSLTRARYFIVRSIGQERFAAPMLRVATYLVKSGLVEEGMSLAEQTDQAIIRPETVFGELAAFFDAVGRAGYGERPMVQYTSPRWQKAAGVDPRDPRCATLAGTFARSTVRPVAPWMLNYDVPQVSTEQFNEVFTGRLRPVGSAALRYDAVDKQYDAELEAYLRYMLDSGEPGEGEPRPLPAVFERDDVVRIREGFAPGNDHDSLAETMVQAAQIIDDPNEDATLRTALAFDVLVHVKASLPAVETQAMRALPAVANIHPAHAAFFSHVLGRTLGERGDADDDTVSNLLTFASGLIAGSTEHDKAYLGASELARWSGRYHDSIWLGHKQLSHLLAYPEKYDDAGEIQLAILQDLLCAAAEIGSVFNVVEYADRGRELAEALGEDDIAAEFIARMAETYLSIDQYDAPMRLYLSYMPQPEMTARRAFPMAAVGVRATSALTDDAFAEYWPHARAQFVRCAEDIVAQAAQKRISPFAFWVMDKPLSVIIHDAVTETTFNLIDTGRPDQAVEWTAWAVEMSKLIDDLSVRAGILSTHGIALDSVEDYSKAAAVFETVVDWGVEAGDDGLSVRDAGLDTLRTALEKSGAAEYSEALARMEQ